jgi:HEAT repeat protein
MADDFEILLEALSDEQLPLPLADLIALSDLSRERLDRFSKTWLDLSVERQRLLLSTLGQQADEKIELSFEAINRAALSNPDADVRRIAINNLWECEDANLIPIYLGALANDPGPGVRIAAAEALGRFVLLGEIAKIAPEYLAETEDTLLAATASNCPTDLFQACVEALGYSSRPEATEIISTAYDEGDESLQGSALIAMGRSYSEQWNPIVMDELISPSPILRNEAARAAGELEIKEAVGLLIDLLEDANDEVRSSATWSLGLIGGDHARTALSELQATTLVDDPISEILQDALDHIDFLDGTPDLLLLDIDPDDEDAVG